jgi:hypothetical protein
MRTTIFAILAVVASAAVAAPTCDSVDCGPGKHCIAFDGKPACVEPLTCATVDCIAGFTCVEDENTPGNPRCVPKYPAATLRIQVRQTGAPLPLPSPPPSSSDLSCANVRCANGTTCEMVAGKPECAAPGTQEERTECGDKTCAAGEYCCNASCGTCAPEGGFCTAQFCG